VCVCVCLFVHVCVGEIGIERENLKFPSLLSVKAIVEGCVGGDEYTVCVHVCPCVCVFVCQCYKVESVCVVVFVRYCPPTGFLCREHDIKRDR